MEKDGIKTFDTCLDCQFLGSTCGGPNFLAQNHERWAEWCNARRKKLGLSLDKLTELSNLPKATVVRALGRNTQGTSIETMKGITKVLVGGSWGTFPCANPPGVESDLLDEMREKDSVISYMQENDKKKVEYLKDIIMEKKKVIKVLSIVAGVLGAVLIGVLMFDVFNPAIGFFR